MTLTSATLALVWTLVLSQFSVTASPLAPRSNGPKRVLDINFPDPGLVKAPDGWYAFGTNDGKANVPIAKSVDFYTDWNYLGVDALPTLPNWAAPGATWAPDVLQRDDGQFVLYFAGASKSRPGSHCVGAALSPNVTGPYAPQADPIVCDFERGSVIDPAGFRHSNGTYYVVYKVDGIDHGGNCNNGKPPFAPTPIMLQRLGTDVMTPEGPAVQILDRDDSDGPLVEAPSLIEINNKFVLFFSSNCFNGPFYDTSCAYADSVTGPYTKIRGNEQPSGVTAPLLKTGSYSLSSPGGWTISKDGTKAVFHANRNGQNTNDGRAMYIANVTIESTSWGSLVTIV
jgi:beta-xylosidase